MPSSIGFSSMTVHSLRNNFGVFYTFTRCYIRALHSLRNDFRAFSPLLGVWIELCIPLGTTLGLFRLSLVTLDGVISDLLQIIEGCSFLMFLATEM
jgi:hypothetical protein